MKTCFFQHQIETSAGISKQQVNCVDCQILVFQVAKIIPGTFKYVVSRLQN